MTRTYPDESVQALTDPKPSWWQEDNALGRGSLVRTIVPYPDQRPFRFAPIGRGQEARQHDQAQIRLEEFRMGASPT